MLVSCVTARLTRFGGGWYPCDGGVYVNDDGEQWSIVAKFSDAHTEPISHIGSCVNARQGGERWLVSSAADGNVCVFRRENGTPPSCLRACLRMGALPEHGMAW